jgi:opacity protein-like surface antigen
MRLKLAVLGLFLFAALPTFSQVAPSATHGGIPIVIGAGYSNYQTDWSGNLSGATLWIDWTASRVPNSLQGIGLEVEGRDLNFDRTGDNPKLRMDTAKGGPIYHWHHFTRFQPYVKFTLGFGSIDFSNKPGDFYTHDTRTIYAPGGGGDYRLWRNVWLRADYEYEAWPDMYDHKILDPQGFTIGATYDLGRLASH